MPNRVEFRPRCGDSTPCAKRQGVVRSSQSDPLRRCAPWDSGSSRRVATGHIHCQTSDKMAWGPPPTASGPGPLNRPQICTDCTAAHGRVRKANRAVDRIARAAISSPLALRLSTARARNRPGCNSGARRRGHVSLVGRWVCWLGGEHRPTSSARVKTATVEASSNTPAAASHRPPRDFSAGPEPRPGRRGVCTTATLRETWATCRPERQHGKGAARPKATSIFSRIRRRRPDRPRRGSLSTQAQRSGPIANGPGRRREETRAPSS